MYAITRAMHPATNLYFQIKPTLTSLAHKVTRAVHIPPVYQLPEKSVPELFEEADIAETSSQLPTAYRIYENIKAKGPNQQAEERSHLIEPWLNRDFPTC